MVQLLLTNHWSGPPRALRTSRTPPISLTPPTFSHRPESLFCDSGLFTSSFSWTASYRDLRLFSSLSESERSDESVCFGAILLKYVFCIHLHHQSKHYSHTLSFCCCFAIYFYLLNHFYFTNLVEFCHVVYFLGLYWLGHAEEQQLHVTQLFWMIFVEDLAYLVIRSLELDRRCRLRVILFWRPWAEWHSETHTRRKRVWLICLTQILPSGLNDLLLLRSAEQKERIESISRSCEVLLLTWSGF